MTTKSIPSERTTLFDLGRRAITPGVNAQLHPIEILRALDRHSRGDWGEVCTQDQHANDAAVENGTRLLSVYHSPKGVRFWIITEADRSSTTVLLPEEY